MRSATLNLFLVVSLSFCSHPAFAQSDANVNRPVKDKWALVVGISEFQNKKLSLRYAAKDAQDFAQFLVKECNFAPDHVRCLTNERATEKHIMSELGSKWLPRVANPDDLVVIYISSHGSPAEMDMEGVNYVVAYDTDVDDLYTTAIEMQDLIGTVKRRVHSDRVVLILDACHSGAASTQQSKGLTRVTNVDAAAVAQGTGQLVICSSKPDQVSWEYKEQPNSVFTRCLIDALRKNGNATKLGDAYETMKDKVQETVLRERGTLQTPVLKSAWKGNELVIAARPVAPRPGLPDGGPADNPSPPPPIKASAPAQPPVVVQPAVTGGPVGRTSDTSPSPLTKYPPAVASTQPPAVASIPPPATTQSPTSTQSSSSAPSTVIESRVAKPISVAVLPFAGPVKVSVQDTTGYKVLWGLIKSPAELSGIQSKMTEAVFKKVRARCGNGVLGPRVVSEALIVEGLTRDPNAVDCRAWTQEQWRKLGWNLEADYILAGIVDEVAWSTSTMANKYTFVSSAKLIDGHTGSVVDEVVGQREHKAPFRGDTGGGRQYFDNEVVPDAARHLTARLLKRIPSGN